MVIRKIQRSPTDEVFRRYVRQLIESAKREIHVITGEASAYEFIDLRLAAIRAGRRGVKIHVYATNPPQELINGFVANGISLYKGHEEVKDHYIVVDSNSCAVSRSHPPGAIGTRRGSVYLNEPKLARKAISYFDQLTSNAKKTTRIDWENDPAWIALRDPPDWGVKTDSSRVHEELH